MPGFSPWPVPKGHIPLFSGTLVSTASSILRTSIFLRFGAPLSRDVSRSLRPLAVGAGRPFSIRRRGPSLRAISLFLNGMGIFTLPLFASVRNSRVHMGSFSSFFFFCLFLSFYFFFSSPIRRFLLPPESIVLRRRVVFLLRLSLFETP